MRAFTLMESLVVVALIVGLLAIGVTTYRRAKWQAKVMNHAAENRQRVNKAVAEGKFRKQKTFEDEMARLKRQTEIGQTQGK